MIIIPTQYITLELLLVSDDSSTMSTQDYKSSKEAFVSGMSGSSIGHVNMVSFVALVRILSLYVEMSRLVNSLSV